MDAGTEHGCFNALKDLTTYEGECYDGKPSGRGVKKWHGGSRYEGEFKEGEMYGQGVFSRPDGRRFEGEWKDGKESGRGVMWLPGSGVFDGVFIEGYPQHGTAMEPGGALFRTVFHGKTYLNSDNWARAERTMVGRIAPSVQGERYWPPQGENGRLLPEWRARLVLQDKTVMESLEGTFCGLRPHGSATLVAAGGATYTVKYDGARTIAEELISVLEHKEARSSAMRAPALAPPRSDRHACFLVKQ
jgi:hypothetical protein